MEIDDPDALRVALDLINRAVDMTPGAREAIEASVVFDLADDWEAAAVFTRMLGSSWYPDIAGRCVPLKQIKVPLAPGFIHMLAANRYLEEARSLREGVVPPDAFVEVDLAPYRGCYIRELKNNVYFAWESFDDDGRPEYSYLKVNVNLETTSQCFLGGSFKSTMASLDAANRLDLSIPDNRRRFWELYTPELQKKVQRFTGIPKEAFQETFYAIFAVTAAILRDFWVIENKESAFRIGPPRIRKFRGYDGKNARRVIYLPRCRYSKERFEREVPQGEGDLKQWVGIPSSCAISFPDFARGSQGLSKAARHRFDPRRGSSARKNLGQRLQHGGRSSRKNLPKSQRDDGVPRCGVSRNEGNNRGPHMVWV